MMHPPRDWTDREAAAEYLAALTIQLASRVREDDPAAVVRWLRSLSLPTDEWPALTIVMAAHIDVDRTQAELISWALPEDDPARWRSAKAEYVRLRAAGKPIPDEVRRGESRYNMALRKQKVEAAQAGAA